MTQPPLVLGDKVWCPRCGEYVKVVRVAGAARIVDVDRRTVYNYVKKKQGVFGESGREHVAHLYSLPASRKPRRAYGNTQQLLTVGQERGSDLNAL